MYCPACKEALVVLEYEQLELDYCAACRGVWVDAGELELLYGDEQACEAFLAGGGVCNAASKRRCPHCSARMEERRTGSDRPVTYDRCPRGHGLWFDRGELASVLSHGHPHDCEERLVLYLREVFPEEPPDTSGTTMS
ncbi:MAG: zf-TFIIB domain-containing protein [FCB group bacterium]|nr:zf-TFIIB domain-containing protein [FCB group bacterium]